MASKELSPVMMEAVANASVHGGQLVRRPGGYWTYRGCPSRGKVPEWYVGTNTVHALIMRGCVEVTERLARGDPCRVALADDPLAAPAKAEGDG